MIGVSWMIFSKISIIEESEQIKHYIVTVLVLILAIQDIFMINLFRNTSIKFINLLYNDIENKCFRHTLKSFIYIILVFMIVRWTIVISIFAWSVIDAINMSDESFLQFLPYIKSDKIVAVILYIMMSSVPVIYGFVMLSVLVIFGNNETIFNEVESEMSLYNSQD